MTKLTTERLEELANATTPSVKYVGREMIEMARKLLAYEQAAKNPIGSFHISDGKVEATTDYCRDGEWPVQDGEVLVYAAPVLPKQPELLSIGELLQRLEEQTGEKWVEESEQPTPMAFDEAWENKGHLFVDNKQYAALFYGLGYKAAPAQPVIPEQENILGYFSFDPEDGAEILKDRQTAIDNCNASIDLYRESMQEEYPDGWSDDVKRVCWGVILQEARGFDAQGIPEDDPNHTYQTLDYRLAPDLTTAVTTQPESEIPFGDVEPMEVTDDMVYAFHNRLSDGSLTSDEFTDIKQGLCAALMNIPRPAQPVSEPYKLKDAVADIRNSGVEIDADKIKAERDALNTPVIPDGWKLVPIEPTAKMFHAFNDCDYGRKSMRERYIQMIEAAPAQEQK